MLNHEYTCTLTRTLYAHECIKEHEVIRLPGLKLIK